MRRGWNVCALPALAGQPFQLFRRGLGTEWCFGFFFSILVNSWIGRKNWPSFYTCHSQCTLNASSWMHSKNWNDHIYGSRRMTTSKHLAWAEKVDFFGGGGVNLTVISKLKCCVKLFPVHTCKTRQSRVISSHFWRQSLITGT